MLLQMCMPKLLPRRCNTLITLVGRASDGARMGGRARVQAHSSEAACGGCVCGALPVLCCWMVSQMHGAVFAEQYGMRAVAASDELALVCRVAKNAKPLQLRTTPHLARQVDLYRGLQEGLLPREAPLLLILHGIVGTHRIHRPGSHSLALLRSHEALLALSGHSSAPPCLLWQGPCLGLGLF